MSLKYAVVKNRNSFILYLSSCFLLLGIFFINLCAQSADKRDQEIKLTELDTTVRSEDAEKARLKAEDIKLNVDKSIDEINFAISNLERDAKAMDAYLDKLQFEKKDYQDRATNTKFIELLDKELDVVKKKIDVDKEQIETYEDQITVLKNQTKMHADLVVLLKSILRLEDTLIASHEQTPMIRKEADIAKSYITAVQASIKEKESVVSFFTNRLEEIKDKTANDERELIQDLELLKNEITVDELIKKTQEKIDSILLLKKSIDSQWVTIFTTRLETSKIRYDQAMQSLKIAQYNSAYLVEKANRLEEKQRIEELKKKQSDLEAAKIAEEENKRLAEITRAEAEKTLLEAAKKAEEVALEKMVTTSPEKMMVLELEAEVHEQVGLVAKRRDELITEGSLRYKDVTEYKKLEANIEQFLSKGGITKETEELLEKIQAEKEQFTGAINAIENLIVSVKQEEKLFSDNLRNANEEIVKVEKEAMSFKDKELAHRAKEYVHQKVEAQNEQLKLITMRLARLNERLEIKKNAIALLQRTEEKLFQIKAANVWTRVESTISTQTFRTVYKDILGFYSHPDFFTNAIQQNLKNFISCVSIKQGFTFWVRICGLIILLIGFYFSKKYIRWLCTSKMQALGGVVNQSYCNSRLIPSLLTVLQNSINISLIAILSIAIPGIFNFKATFITAIIYVLIFIAIYRILKGFLVESFGTEKADRKLIPSLAYVSPRHLYKSLNSILSFSLVSLSIITVLSIYEYRSDVLELLWFIYRMGMLMLLLWLATQKTLILKLLPDVESSLGKIIHGVINYIYPVFVVFIVSLFAIRGLGYPVLTYLLLKTCIKSFVIAFIAFGIWKYLYYRMNYYREMRLKKGSIKRGTPEEKRYHTATTIYNVSFKYTVSIIALVVIIRVWVRTFHDAVSSPAAPYLVQKTFGQIGSIFGAFGNGLRYRFFFEEGKYTTPLKVIVALAILFASFFVARYVKLLLEEKVFSKLRLERGSRQTLSTLIKYIVVGVAALIGLNLAGIPLKSLAFFAGAFGIGIGFGMQNVISNFVSGIILLLERPMRVGDIIALEDGTLGTIDKISARSTTINTPDAITVTVPNSKFIESKITNWTHPTALVRGCVKVGVAYGSNTTLVKNCLLQVAKQNLNVRTDPEPIVRFAEFGDSALLFELYFWADDPKKRWLTVSELNFAIDEIFRKNNIEIAFPQRDIHIRSIVPFPVQNIQGNVAQGGNQEIVYKKTDV